MEPTATTTPRNDKKLENNSNFNVKPDESAISKHNEELIAKLQILTNTLEKKEYERRKLKDHNDDVINSLVAERDEIIEMKFDMRKKLQESTTTINKMEEERRKLKDLNESLITERNCMSAHNCVLQARLDKINENASGDLTPNIDVSKEKESCRKICSSVPSTDSGVDMQSLTKLIVDRVGIMIMMDSKLKDHVQPNQPPRMKTNEEEFVEVIPTNIMVSNRLNEPSNTNTIPDKREFNIIIHGLREDSTKREYDRTVIKELFDTVGLEYHSPSSIDRLGVKTFNNVRPMRLTMATRKEKSEFMSKLGRLRYGPEILKKISITDDYTLEERKEIHRWVEEAKRRSMNEDGYEWKVRGSPKSKLRLIKIDV